MLALIGVSMPVFWLGIVTRYYLAEGGLTTFFPDGEYVPLTDESGAVALASVLPWTVLAVLFIGFYGRVLRGNILDTSNEDYVRTAKAKGLPPNRIMRKHILRLSLIPIVTLFGLDFAAVLGGGAILTETVFDLHGVGQYAAQSINNFDLPPIMGVTHVRRVLHRRVQRVRRHLLRVPRPADPADVDGRAASRGQGPQGRTSRPRTASSARSTASRSSSSAARCSGSSASPAPARASPR